MISFENFSINLNSLFFNFFLTHFRVKKNNLYWMNISFLNAIKFNKQNLNTFIKMLYYSHITSNPKDIALSCLHFYTSLDKLLMVRPAQPIFLLGFLMSTEVLSSSQMIISYGWGILVSYQVAFHPPGSFVAVVQSLSRVPTV